jgi:hypothetical protein
MRHGHPRLRRRRRAFCAAAAVRAHEDCCPAGRAGSEFSFGVEYRREACTNSSSGEANGAIPHQTAGWWAARRRGSGRGSGARASEQRPAPPAIRAQPDWNRADHASPTLLSSTPSSSLNPPSHPLSSKPHPVPPVPFPIKGPQKGQNPRRQSGPQPPQRVGLTKHSRGTGRPDPDAEPPPVTRGQQLST